MFDMNIIRYCCVRKNIENYWKNFLKIFNIIFMLFFYNVVSYWGYLILEIEKWIVYIVYWKLVFVFRKGKCGVIFKNSWWSMVVRELKIFINLFFFLMVVFFWIVFNWYLCFNESEFLCFWFWGINLKWKWWWNLIKCWKSWFWKFIVGL